MIDFTELRKYYSRFLNAHPGRILLTGHSHQAWPNVSRDAQIKAWDDAALRVDEKWDVVFREVIPAFQRHIAKRIGEEEPTLIAVGQNTLEFLFRLLSCFKIDESMSIVSTTSEFHSLSRLLNRLEEEHVHIARVDTADRSTLTERIINAITPGTTLVMLSLVFFDTSFILQHVGDICARARVCGATILIDAYHAFNVVPFATSDFGEDVFVLGGGYKYSQSGEGACWMRVPKSTALRPIYTGWFVDFSGLEDAATMKKINYSNDGFRFLGATFDPTPFYRANAAFDFMDQCGMTPTVLRDRSLHLTQFIIDLYDKLKLEEQGLGLASSRDPMERGGFVSFEHQLATELSQRLKEKNIWTDARGSYIRFGPAPYNSEEEIERAINVFGSQLPLVKK